MKELEPTTKELILDKIDTLKKEKQTRQEILPKIAEKEPRFEQMQQIEITLIDEQIEMLRQMIIRGTE